MQIKHLCRRLLAAFGVVALASGTAMAQDYYPSDQMVTVSSASLGELLRRVDVLEASLGGDGKNGDGKNGDGKNGDGKGWVDTSDEGWTSRVGGWVMWDQVYWAQQDAGSLSRFGDLDNYTEFRQLRLFLEGTGWGVYDYRLGLDFEPEVGRVDDPAVSLRDAWIGMRGLPFNGYVRVGHQREPFSMEEGLSGDDDLYTMFLERSLANVFVPGRQTGITATAHNSRNTLHGSGGIFYNALGRLENQDFNGNLGNDLTKEIVSDNQGVDVVGRGWWSYYDDPSDGRYAAHLGTGFVYRDDQNDMVRFRSRPEIHEGPAWVDTGFIALDEDYWTSNIEGAFVYGPLSVQAEAFWTRLNTPMAGRPDLYGAYLQASFFLTGENRNYDPTTGSFRRVRPYSNFWIVPGCIGRGAWEVAARWSYLDLEDVGTLNNVNVGTLHDFTLGVNWYLNPQTRVMWNYIHPFGNYTFPVNGLSDAEGDIFAMRLQFDF